MDLTPVTPRKRLLSSGSNPADVSVDNINSNAFSLFPYAKRLKTSHRWVDEDEELIERVQQAFHQNPKTPSAKVVRTTGEDGLTIITHKHKYYQFEDDLMDAEIRDFESEFQYPTISTPASVKGFAIAEDIEPEDQPEEFQEAPTSSNPARILNYRSFFYESMDDDLDSEPQTLVETVTASHNGDAQLPADQSSDGADADEEFSLSDEPDYNHNSSLNQESSSGQSSDEADNSKWIRKKKPYGIILAPQLDSDESAYQTTDDDDHYVGDDERDDADPSPPRIHVWTEREEQVFRALVCDYGRKWARFVPLFPGMSVEDIEEHYHHVIATRPEFRLDEVADAAENGEYLFTPPTRSGHWHTFAADSDRLVLGGVALER